MIKVGILFKDKLNLYGEIGNIKALEYHLKNNDIKYTIDYLDIEDDLDFKVYDFIYIGSGRKKELEEIKNILTSYKDDILNYINKDKVMLVTGNAIGIFDFLGLYEIEEFAQRKVADVTATTSLCNGVIKGFQNTEYLIKSTNSILFNVDSGYGNNSTLMEGYQKNNFYATSIIGPILALNDNLINYFIDLIKESDN